MPLALLNPIDYGVLLLYLAAVIVLGVYFSSRQKNVAEFLLASRSLGWLPAGLSLAALISGLSYTGLPGQAYEQGLRCWIIPAMLWLALPIAVFVAIPIYRGLGLASLYEYLEHRFDARVRLAASTIFVAWRLLWLGTVVYVPCQALLIAAGWNMPVWALIVPLGFIATLYAFLGGLRAVVWTGVVQGGLMLLGTIVVVVSIWASLDDGPARVAELATGLGRMEPANLSFSWTDPWTLWGAVPHWFLAVLAYYLADQITAQRYLSAKCVNAACSSYVLNAIALTFLLPGLIYVGMCLFAFYYDHPQEMAPEWVVNLDNKTLQPIAGADGRPLLDPRNPEHAVTWESVDRLAAEGRILQPNSKEPFTSASDLVDPDTNEVRIDRLAMRKINRGKQRGEIIVGREAPAQMLPRYIASRLGWGAAGIVLAALLAWAMSSFASGVHSVSTLMMIDFHRRSGWGRSWLAGRLDKPADALNDVDELQLARPLTLVLGTAATLLAVALAMIGDLFTAIVGIVNAACAPLLAVFLLGMLTRRTTGPAALIAAAMGSLFTIGVAAANRLAAADLLIPQRYAVAEIWNVVFGVLFTFGLGYALSFAVGQRKSNLDLRGLVAGCGTPGVRSTDEAHPLISLPEEPAVKWK